ncbi:tetratricopeptide repeat protein [Cesiribacter andamanensis]|uniref:Tol-pal system protein YbgF n=1 Tax=Cesiribacter andamanensis AMV16 TaxID=1279009 RepID=M7P121_9BACT|nr:Tol-Pal system protein YbgF [Cesiribacter andamanensis]EMR04269.1 tol-pal system protein YbgF [Cesiribacter andamanensis AMV16]
MRYLVLLLLMVGGFSASAQTQLVEAPELSAREKKLLLMDMTLQMETAEAINHMYNFKFAKAEQQFRWIRQKYPHHPLPYFLMGLSQWWKIMPNIEEERYDGPFMLYMDSTIVLAERILAKDADNAEARFFLSGAWAFKSRLHSERSNWRKAAVTGKKALEYLDMKTEKQELGSEFLFGDGLYNYYAEWVPKNYPLLKPILMFFPSGDQKRGIQQLKDVAQNAFYTRTEAQYYLMRILALDENKPYEALRISEYLHKTYPDNPYFHRYYARMLYTTGQYTKLEEVAKNILHKIDSRMPGYEAISGRYAAFYLGQMYDVLNRHVEARTYFLRVIAFAKSSNDLDSGYMLYSLLALGDMAKEDGDEKLAKRYYKEVKKYGSRSHGAHERARAKLKEM